MAANVVNSMSTDPEPWMYYATGTLDIEAAANWT